MQSKLVTEDARTKFGDMLADLIRKRGYTPSRWKLIWPSFLMTFENDVKGQAQKFAKQMAPALSTVGIPASAIKAETRKIPAEGNYPEEIRGLVTIRLDKLTEEVSPKETIRESLQNFVSALTEEEVEFLSGILKTTEETISESTKALRKKAAETGISYRILKKVYDRGMAAWKGGHRPGATPQQWALARVNSFVTGGKTRHTADADLWKQTGKG